MCHGIQEFIFQQVHFYQLLIGMGQQVRGAGQLYRFLFKLLIQFQRLLRLFNYAQHLLNIYLLFLGDIADHEACRCRADHARQDLFSEGYDALVGLFLFGRQFVPHHVRR